MPDRDALILALETSCDETSAAVVRADGELLSLETASQIEAHRPYGGVVPELASRNHTVLTPQVVRRALDLAGVEAADMSGFAATAGPGLASALLVGNTTAKAMALGTGKPFFAINHMEGHLLSPFFGGDVPFPFLGLVVSGGHTLLIAARGVGDYELLGQSRDDAAGEAFDKVGKLFGLPYPGGPEIDRLASGGNPAAFALPRSMMDRESLEFSFSGLKNASRLLVESIPAAEREARLPDLCASFQEAVVEVLVAKTRIAARRHGLRCVAVSGGVACNTRLRAALVGAAAEDGWSLHLAAPKFAVDNAAMIAQVAHLRLAANLPTPLDSGINPNLALSGTEKMRGHP